MVRASMVLLCLVWGSTWVVIRGGLRDLPPFTSAAARFVVSGAAMSALVALLGRRESGKPPPTFLWLVLGTLSFGASYAIVYRTETLLPSGLVSLLWSVFPMLMAISGHWFLPGERLRGVHWLGFTIGSVGLALLFSTDLAELGPEAIPGAALLLVSPVVSAIATTVVKLHGAGVSSMRLNRNAMLLGAALLSVLALATEDVTTATWTPRALLSVVYLALAGTVLTFGLYFWLLRYVDAHKMSLIAFVTPTVALALGWLTGEPVTYWTLGGAACVLGGVALVVTARRVAPERSR
ncbi:MAG: EamA family transporter [Planctomycetes bacterium]|nr:EamA family transporter [Planctomycetota bacterium]